MPLLSEAEHTPSQAGGPGATANRLTRLLSSDRASKVPSRLFGTAASPDIRQLADLCSSSRDSVTLDNYRLAAAVDNDIPIYDAATLEHEQHIFDRPGLLSTLQDEMYEALLDGPGVFVLKHMYTALPGQASVIDAANNVFQSIIASEAAANGNKGDHFAAGGKNSRIWNSFSKHALADPDSFVRYYSNRWLRLVSEAWLGPAYRITTQVNLVRPGGAPQVSHRDYHLGFQTAEACQRFPVAMQIASQLLTLQGAVAHSDMPLASGPTRFLPFSQRLKEGYMAYRLPEFVDYFDRHWVSLPLEKGDGVFFNPALFHAAGENGTDHVQRSANLIQVSSAFGKTMESIDSVPIVAQCWSRLLGMFDEHGLSQELETVIKAVGEGYPFPTNLDRRPPAPGGAAPEDEQMLLRRCLEERRSTEFVVAALAQMKHDSQA